MSKDELFDDVHVMKNYLTCVMMNYLTMCYDELFGYV